MGLEDPAARGVVSELGHGAIDGLGRQLVEKTVTVPIYPRREIGTTTGLSAGVVPPDTIRPILNPIFQFTLGTEFAIFDEF